MKRTVEDYKLRLIDAVLLRGNDLYLMQVGFFKQINEERPKGMMNLCHFEFKTLYHLTQTQRLLTLEEAFVLVEENIDNVPPNAFIDIYPIEHYDDPLYTTDEFDRKPNVK